MRAIETIKQRVKLYVLLDKYKDKEMSLAKIIREVGTLTYKNASKIVNYWENKGLLRKERFDGRQNKIIFTDKGIRYLKALSHLKGKEDFFSM
jgi:predicted transcriptional regulator